MDLARVCSECPNTLRGKPPTAKTCSAACRSKRSRRLKRQAKEAGALKALPEHQKEIAARVRGQMSDVAHDVIETELRPVVREAITEETLRAIQQMVGLTPLAVEAIQEDLASDDPVLRQRAYSLVMKYTVGHGAIVTPESDDKTRPLQVNFNLPRPEEEQPATAEVEAEAVETKVCDLCGADKPVIEFVAASDRCKSCHRAQSERAASLLDSTARD